MGGDLSSESRAIMSEISEKKFDVNIDQEISTTSPPNNDEHLLRLYWPQLKSGVLTPDLTEPGQEPARVLGWVLCPTTLCRTLSRKLDSTPDHGSVLPILQLPPPPHFLRHRLSATWPSVALSSLLLGGSVPPVFVGEPRPGQGGVYGAASELWDLGPHRYGEDHPHGKDPLLHGEAPGDSWGQGEGWG